jgi:hypothetical protein
VGGALDAGAGRRLDAMRVATLDGRRPAAIKRNVHELDIDAPAPRFARALAQTLADPTASFGLVAVRRVDANTGRPFAAGERFAGCFRLALAARAWGAPGWLVAALDRADAAGLLPWIENRLTSDHAELRELALDGDGDGHGDGAGDHGDDAAAATMAYRYLDGTPLAGESRYTIEARGEGARLTVTFHFQETAGWAIALLHGFGIRQHDLAVLAQAEAAAARLGARVVAHTIRGAGPR